MPPSAVNLTCSRMAQVARINLFLFLVLKKSGQQQIKLFWSYANLLKLIGVKIVILVQGFHYKCAWYGMVLCNPTIELN